MISFTRHAPRTGGSNDYSRTHGNVDVDAMDIEDDEADGDGLGSGKVTIPGDVLTSSHAYMRCVSVFY